MARETKSLITREEVKKEMILVRKALMASSILYFAIILLICGPFVGVAIAHMFSRFWWLYLLEVALFSVPPTVFLVKIIGYAKEKRLVENGEFSIVKDTVSRLSRGEIIARNQTADVLYFKEYGRYIPSQTVFDLTTVGEEFYLVILHNKKQEITEAYHTLMYECKETEQD